jgi:hypothetical protein
MQKRRRLLYIASTRVRGASFDRVTRVNTREGLLDTHVANCMGETRIRAAQVKKARVMNGVG